MFRVTIKAYEEPALIGVGRTPFSAMVQCYEQLAIDVSDQFLAELTSILGQAASHIAEGDDAGESSYIDMDVSMNYTICLESFEPAK